MTPKWGTVVEVLQTGHADLFVARSSAAHTVELLIYSSYDVVHCLEMS
jgi:ribosomal 30S subunit maturation factor RimM